jgi:trans-aconitate methyltransferase
MTEYRFFDPGTIPEVSTEQWHAPRDRAHHWEEPTHGPRLRKAREYVLEAQRLLNLDGGVPYTGGWPVSDLGCGDGGLLMGLKQAGLLNCWGYDFTPANVEGGRERGVDVRHRNFLADWQFVTVADIVVMTEVLEHMHDPHRMLLRVASSQASFLVASSPNGETPDCHIGYHTWGWDMAGYAEMLHRAGFDIVLHEPVDSFQVVLAQKDRSLR